MVGQEPLKLFILVRIQVSQLGKIHSNTRSSRGRPDAQIFVCRCVPAFEKLSINNSLRYFDAVLYNESAMKRYTLIFVVACMMMVPAGASAMTVGGVFHSLWCSFEKIFGHECAIESPEALPITSPISGNAAPSEGSPVPDGQEQSGQVLGEATTSAQSGPAAPVTVDPDPDFDTEQFVQRRELETQLAEMRSEFNRALLASATTTVVQAPQTPPTPIMYASSGGGGKNYAVDVQSLWHAISLMNNIDALSNVTINGSTITNSSVSGNFTGTFNGTVNGTNTTASSTSFTSFTSTDATTGSLSITNVPNALLSTNALGSVIAATAIDQSYLTGIDKGFFFSTTSADAWSSQRNFFSTSSASFFLLQNQGAAFSTTSANFLLNSSSTIVTTNKNVSFLGSLSAATATAAILDTGGQVCNVQAYGAVGNDSTDNYAAIESAMAACPVGGIIYFPPGIYRISQTINLDKPVTFQGSYAPRWSYDSTPRSSIKAATPFTGTSLIHVRENTISGQAAANDGGRILDMSLDGNSYGTGIDGIYFEGLVVDWKMVDVDISQTSGDGFEAAQGAGTSNARGFTIQHLSIYSPGGHGFRASSLNDSSIDDLLVVGGAQRGIYLTSIGETKISNSRAVFNALEGLYIDGASTNGGLQFTNFSTDRNDRQGVRISATGTTSISFMGLLTRRDGPNTGGGSETPYAGVAIIGTSTGYVAPVIISGLTQIPGVNDDGSGTPSPAVGVRAQYSTYVQVNGVLWGTTNAYLNLGNNNNFIIAEDTLLKTGYSTVTSALYNAKWALSTTSPQTLVYFGKVSVGTSTPTAQFQTTGTVRFSNFGAGTLQTDASGNLTVSSDERLKNIQGPFATGLDALLNIHPILYHWNASSGFDQTTLYAGFSAQNVQAEIPEAVGVDPNGFLTLSDRPILAAIVNAIQQIWETVTGNTKKIDDLEARVAVLEHQLNIQPPATDSGTSTQGAVGDAASSTSTVQSDASSSAETIPDATSSPQNDQTIIQ